MILEKIIHRPAEVANLLGISISTLDRWSKKPEFPQKIKLSSRVVGFDSSEIYDFIEKQKEGETK